MRLDNMVEKKKKRRKIVSNLSALGTLKLKKRDYVAKFTVYHFCKQV